MVTRSNESVKFIYMGASEEEDLGASALMKGKKKRPLDSTS